MKKTTKNNTHCIIKLIQDREIDKANLFFEKIISFLSDWPDIREIEELQLNANLYMVRDLYIVRDTHVNGEHKQTQQLVGNIEHFESEFVTLKAFNILNELPYIGNTI